MLNAVEVAVVDLKPVKSSVLRAVITVTWNTVSIPIKIHVHLDLCFSNKYLYVYSNGFYYQNKILYSIYLFITRTLLYKSYVRVRELLDFQ